MAASYNTFCTHSEKEVIHISKVSLFISCHEIICPDKLSSRLLCKIQQNNTPKRDIDPKSCAHGKQKIFESNNILENMVGI